MTKLVVATLSLFAIALVLPACGKKVGSSCKGSESSCLDKKTALACQGAKLVNVSCGGPLGCTKYQDHANCDTSVANEGDPCMGDGEDEYACSPDRKRAVVCKSSKFEKYLECRGKQGCSVLGRTVACDTSVASKGDPCKSQGAVACSEDQKLMLTCRDGKFDIYRYCRGQYGCFMKGEAPSCDETLSQDGDPCGIPGQVVCNVDQQSELVCQNGVFSRSRGCKKGCTVTNRPGRPIDCN